MDHIEKKYIFIYFDIQSCPNKSHLMWLILLLFCYFKSYFTTDEMTIKLLYAV